MTMDNETKLKYAKTAVNFVVSRSVSTVVSTIIVQNMNTDELNRRKKIEIAIGSNVIGKMVGAQTKQFVDKKFDSAVATYAKARAFVYDTKPDNPQD